MATYRRVIWVPFTLNLQSKWSLHAYFCVGRCNPHRDKLHGLGHTSGTPKQKLQGLGPVPFHLFSSDKDYVNFWWQPRNAFWRTENQVPLIETATWGIDIEKVEDSYSAKLQSKICPSDLIWRDLKYQQRCRDIHIEEKSITGIPLAYWFAVRPHVHARILPIWSERMTTNSQQFMGFQRNLRNLNSLVLFPLLAFGLQLFIVSVY